MLLVKVLCVLLILTIPAIGVLLDEIVTSVSTTAVQSGVARLPCDLQTDNPVNRVILVIWYKDGATTPIYSVDARGGSLDEATHWADEHSLGGRAFFRVIPDLDQRHGTHLALENIKDIDAGSYRCRVDFQGAPTRNSVVNLTVIVPPRKLSILDESGTQRKVVGPYTEGSTALISCIATGGRPTPRVTWWRDGVEIDNSYELLKDRKVKNVLRLERLERRHLNNVLTCKAANNDMMPPLVANVTLDIYLRPLDVRLLGENQPLSASSVYEVACQSSGSRPPANISWWKAGLLLEYTRETTSPDGNVTTSILTFTPQVEDSGKSLTCRAENSHMRGSAQEETWTLDVLYLPIVTLDLGSNLNGSSIREGMDVYFECIIQANPWVYKVIWRHNGQDLHNNVSTGIILSNQTLVLQSVSRNSSGLYTCVGSNSEGDTESNAFNLDVKFADEPVCRTGQQRVYGAARYEEVTVVCDVDANPPAGLFRWSFNNSAIQSLEVDSVTSEPGGGRSLASYKPLSERDYGTLLCWGRNELGSQGVPCVFHVVPAGKPDTPRNCVVMNRSSNAVHINCVKGFDGGLPQEFIMELYSSADGHKRLVSNITSGHTPEFTVAGLEPWTGYLVSVYAANGKGRSAAFTLSVSTLKSTHQEHRRTAVATTFPLFPQVTPMLWVLAGILVTLAVVGLAALTAFRIRGGSCDCLDQEDDQQTNSGSPETLTDPARKIAPSGTGNLLQGLKGPVLVSAEDMDDRNPDLIPHTAELEYPVEYKSFDKLNVDPRGRSFSVEAQPPKSMSYGHIPHYSSSETVRFEGVPVRWHHQTVTIATQTQNAETQTPILQRHKESAV